MAGKTDNWKHYTPRKQAPGPIESVLYDRIEANRVRCNVCAFRCTISPGHVGVCSVRQNVEGTLYALNYRKCTALHMDPMEKKPLFHFHPGTPTLSLAAPGCNFHCKFCQNFEISHMPEEYHKIEGRNLSAEEIVEEAVRLGCGTMAYTYTEPIVYIEYAAEIATLARERGLRNVFVTNGYATPEATDITAPWLDAVNVDLKGFNDKFYLKVCSARHAPVCESIQRYHARGLWTEVSTPLIPGHNDTDAEVRDMAQFLKGVSPDIPWHLVGFHPDYRMRDVPPTLSATLRRARDIARAEGLNYVYVGNVAVPGAQNTVCPGCGETVIRRNGFRLTGWKLKDGGCARCGTIIPGIGMEHRPDGVQAEFEGYAYCG